MRTNLARFIASETSLVMEVGEAFNTAAAATSSSSRHLQRVEGGQTCLMGKRRALNKYNTYTPAAALSPLQHIQVHM
jgi:hypothetical protein